VIVNYFLEKFLDKFFFLKNVLIPNKIIKILKHLNVNLRYAHVPQINKGIFFDNPSYNSSLEVFENEIIRNNTFKCIFALTSFRLDIS
jgi:hypothetical protein